MFQTSCSALYQISLLLDTMKMNTVSNIQALVQTGKRVEETALKRVPDLVMSDVAACLPSSLSSVWSFMGILQVLLCTFPLMKGLYPKSPENLSSRNPSPSQVQKHEENSGLCPWSGSVEFSTQQTNLAMRPASPSCSSACLLTPCFPWPAVTGETVVFSLLQRQ